MVKKAFIKFIVFLAVFIIIFTVFSNILTPSSAALQGSMNSFRSLEKNSLDALFVGSCHMYSSIMPMEIYNKTGITGHIVASPSQDIPTSYYYIKEALKTQNPKVIVLDVFSISRECTYESEDAFLSSAYSSFSVLSLSPDKIKYIMEFPYKINKLEAMFPFFKFHTRWSSLKPGDFEPQSKEVLLDKGWFLFWNVVSTMPKDSFFDPLRFSYLNGYSERTPALSYDEIQETNTLDPITREYLDKIVKLTRDAGIHLCFMVAPYTMELEEAQKYKAFKEYAGQVNIPVIDFNANSTIQEISLTYADMTDWQHVNTAGALKLTDYMAEYLTANYSFDNKQSESVYKKWDADLALWKKTYS